MSFSISMREAEQRRSSHQITTESRNLPFPEGKIDIDTAADYDRLHVSED